MRHATFIFLALLIFPFNIYATACSDDGYTVIYVNGIFTEKDIAESNIVNLEKVFKELTGRNDVVFRLGHNPSHLAGVGDVVQSIAQTFNSSISDYDRNTILMEIHPKVTTGWSFTRNFLYQRDLPLFSRTRNIRRLDRRLQSCDTGELRCRRRKLPHVYK